MVLRNATPEQRLFRALYEYKYNRANRARLKEKSAKWAAENPEKVREARRAYAVRNAESERSRAVEKEGRRRAAMYGTAAADDARVWAAWLKAVLCLCHWCRKPMAGGAEHIDHYVPLSKGGAHTRTNLVPSCASCNLRKGAKMPEDFRAEVEA